MSRLNKNNSAVKRILQEAKELSNDSCTDYTAAPLEDDIFEWHCTIRGPAGTEFEGGLYHFRILLPSEYPFRPPSIMMLTPNGRFELNTKICISFTNYHEESWQPAWGVRTAILGLQGLFPLKGKAALGVGGLESPISDRKRLAILSRNWECPHCKQTNLECLPNPTTTESLVEEITVIEKHPATEEPLPSEPDSVPETAVIAEYRVPGDPVQPSTAEEPIPDSSISEQPAVDQIPIASVVTTTSPSAITVSPAQSARPPVLLDTAICVLLVLVIALVCRRVL